MTDLFKPSSLSLCPPFFLFPQKKKIGKKGHEDNKSLLLWINCVSTRRIRDLFLMREPFTGGPAWQTKVILSCPPGGSPLSLLVATLIRKRNKEML